jgi:ATP-dependent RNA helicase DeaD
VIHTLAQALETRGYTALTPVQQAVTDPDLTGADLLVSAQTGSGKTVGFGLAIAPTLLDDAAHFGPAGVPLALIIAPTRELALQVKRELSWLYQVAGAVVVSCVGGMDMRDERRALDRGAHIVVATPGRLRDHIQRGSLDMGAVRAVVLDEADEMLDLGFREDLEFILGEAPANRRTLMFSATVPKAIATLAQHYQKDSRRVTVRSDTSQHADIEYRALTVAQHDAENALINVLRFYEAPNALVFCNTRAMVNRLTTRFSNRGFSVVALSGELTQTERTHALQAMRDGRARVCVATDVAARGIDLPNLELVIHAELPSNSETLLHRSGRTGRAGRKGVSALIVPAKARRKAEMLLRGAKVTPVWAEPPSADEVIARDEERLLTDPIWQEPVTGAESGLVATLTDRFSAEQLAAAFVRLSRARQSAPEELSSSGADPAPRRHSDFGSSTWFSVSLGRNRNAEARWLLPMLCRAGNITRDDIGAIRIREEESLVQILDASTAKFVAALGPAMALEDGISVKQLVGEPDLTPSPRPERPAFKAKRAPRDRTEAPTPAATPDPVAAPVVPAADTAPEAPRKPRHAAKTQDAKTPDAKTPQDRPAKPKWQPDRPDRADAPRPKYAKPFDKKPYAPADAKPRGKPYAGTSERPAAPAAPAGDARDPSKRFVPPGKPGASGAPRKRPGNDGPAKPRGPGGKGAAHGGAAPGGGYAQRTRPAGPPRGPAKPHRGKPKP